VGKAPLLKAFGGFLPSSFMLHGELGY